MTDQLLQEVTADLRAAQIDAWWKQNYKKVIALVIALILAIVGITAYQHYKEKRGGELMLKLYDARALYTQKKFADAAESFSAAAETASGDARTMALLWQGRALSAADEKEKAVTVLKTAAGGRASLWSDLACLRLAGLDESAATCLGSAQDSPLVAQRRAWQAASDWQAGNKTKAITALEELATSNAITDQTRSELTQWLGTLRATGKDTE